MKGSMGAGGIVPEAVTLDVGIKVQPKPTPSCVPAPVVGPDMVMLCGEGGSESDKESNEEKEELVWGLEGL